MTRPVTLTEFADDALVGLFASRSRAVEAIAECVRGLGGQLHDRYSRGLDVIRFVRARNAVWATGTPRLVAALLAKQPSLVCLSLHYVRTAEHPAPDAVTFNALDFDSGAEVFTVSEEFARLPCHDTHQRELFSQHAVHLLCLAGHAPNHEAVWAPFEMSLFASNIDFV